MTNRFTSFSISNELVEALTKLGYTEPTIVQEKVIPVALEKKDLLVRSQTGSGKTAAFAIPLCELVEWEENKPQALVLTPTRELAEQVRVDIQNIGRFKRIKAAAIYGKQPFNRQKLELKQKNHIVVGTPGRTLDHIQKGTLSLEKVSFLVIDEADEMLNMGFLEQVESIIKELPVNRTTMLFSATLPEDIERLSATYMKSPESIAIESATTSSGRIDHLAYRVQEADKLARLKDITTYMNPDSCIVFCGTQERVEQLTDALDEAGYPADKLHGGMLQEDRFEVMDDFKRGEFRYLVATDVAARGIDIDNISLVVNYDFPMEKESYVHRTGRTGRAGNSGTAVSFITDRDSAYVEAAEAYAGLTLTPAEMPTMDELADKRQAFEKKLAEAPDLKEDRSEQVNADIMKLYFNGGKKKKLRAVDFVGTIAKIDGVEFADIGIITIQENVTYVEILNGKGPHVLRVMKQTPVKGKKLKVHEARK